MSSNKSWINACLFTAKNAKANSGHPKQKDGVALQASDLEGIAVFWLIWSKLTRKHNWKICSFCPRSKSQRQMLLCWLFCTAQPSSAKIVVWQNSCDFHHFGPASASHFKWIGTLIEATPCPLHLHVSLPETSLCLGGHGDAWILHECVARMMVRACANSSCSPTNELDLENSFSHRFSRSSTPACAVVIVICHVLFAFKLVDVEINSTCSSGGRSAITWRLRHVDVGGCHWRCKNWRWCRKSAAAIFAEITASRILEGEKNQFPLKIAHHKARWRQFFLTESCWNRKSRVH